MSARSPRWWPKGIGVSVLPETHARSAGPPTAAGALLAPMPRYEIQVAKRQSPTQAAGSCPAGRVANCPRPDARKLWLLASALASPRRHGPAATVPRWPSSYFVRVAVAQRPLTERLGRYLISGPKGPTIRLRGHRVRSQRERRASPRPRDRNDVESEVHRSEPRPTEEGVAPARSPTTQPTRVVSGTTGVKCVVSCGDCSAETEPRRPRRWLGSDKL